MNKLFAFSIQKSLDISYQKVENELINDLNALSPTDCEAISNRIESFMKKYLTKSRVLTLNRRYKTYERYLDTNCFHFSFKFVDSYFKRYYKFCDRSQFMEVFRSDLARIFSNDLDYFIFPHSELISRYSYSNVLTDSYLKILHRTFPEPLNKTLIEKWNKAVSLYKKLEELKADDEKWFKCIQEWDDEEFVVHNIEERIGRKLDNKNLWKLYIEFWRSKNPKIMVGVYSRYCSFFLDDLEMKTEYKKEAEKLGIDVDDEMLLLDYKEFRSFLSPTVPIQTKCFIPICNFDDYLRQFFPFHNSFINYLMDYCNPEMLQKLFNCCKYFFKKRSTPICHRLIIAKDQRVEDYIYYFEPPLKRASLTFDKQALTIADDHHCLKDLKNLYLSNSLHIAESFDNGLFKKILPKVYQSKIKYLTIENQTVELNDYIFLTKSGTVESVFFNHTKIINSDSSFAALEDIMETLPNANFIDLRNDLLNGLCSTAVTVNDKSFEKLALMSRNSKFCFFGLGGCNIKAFNSNDFFDFMKIKVMKFINKWKQRVHKADIPKEENDNHPTNVHTTTCHSTTATQTDPHGLLPEHYLQLIKHLPVFGGNVNENFEIFMQEFENKTTNLNDEMKLQVLQLRMHSQATTTLEFIMQSTSNIQWTTLVQNLHQHYAKLSKAHSFNLNLHAITTRKAVNKGYTNKDGFTPKQRQTIMMDNFINGLPTHYSNILTNATTSFSNFDEVIQYAIMLQQQHKHQLSATT